MASKAAGFNFSALHVPSHILDLVATTAKNYVDPAFPGNSRSRWLEGHSSEAAAAIEKNSTHHLVDLPGRRRRHERILLTLAAKNNMLGPVPEKPILFYVCGPMAAGKSTLLQNFRDRIAEDCGQGLVAPYEDKNMERLFQLFNEAQSRLMVSDFPHYKMNLPQFKQHGNEFAIVRAEACGLDVATRAWADELKTNLVQEQLGDGVGERAAELAEKYRLVVLGVTTNLETNLSRLHARNGRPGQSVISDAQLFAARDGFGADDGFPALARHAEFAILTHTTGLNPEVVYAAENGREIYDAELASYPAPTPTVF